METSFIGKNILLKKHDKIFAVFCYGENRAKSELFGMKLRPQSKKDNAKKSRIVLVGDDGLKNSSVAVVHKIKTFKESDILRVLGQVGIKQAEEALYKARSSSLSELIKKRAAIERSISKNKLLGLNGGGLNRQLRTINQLVEE